MQYFKPVILVGMVTFFSCGKNNPTALSETGLGNQGIQTSKLITAGTDTLKSSNPKGKHRKGSKSFNPLKGLNLTEAQKEQVRTLRKAIGEKKKAIMETARSEGSDRKEIGQRLESLKTEYETGLKSILTQQQLTKLEETKAAYKDRTKSRTENRKGPRRGRKQPPTSLSTDNPR